MVVALCPGAQRRHSELEVLPTRPEIGVGCRTMCWTSECGLACRVLRCGLALAGVGSRPMVPVFPAGSAPCATSRTADALEPYVQDGSSPPLEAAHAQWRDQAWRQVRFPPTRLPSEATRSTLRVVRNLPRPRTPGSAAARTALAHHVTKTSFRPSQRLVRPIRCGVSSTLRAETDPAIAMPGVVGCWHCGVED